MAVVAVCVPATAGAAALTACGDPGTPVESSSRPATVAATEVGDRAPLRYSPTWLPPALVERDRAVLADEPLRPGERAPVHRRWYSADAAEGVPRAGVAMTVSDARFPGSAGGCGPGRADINGVPGSISDSCVQWQPDPESRLAIHADLPDLIVLTRDDLLHIARSVRPDPGELTLPFQVGTIVDLFPGSTVVSRQVQGRSPTGWHATVGFRTGDRATPTVTVDVGTGRYRESGDGTIVVTLDGGLTVTVGGPVGDEPSLRAVADRVALAGPDVAATVAWVGTRP